MPFVQVGGEIGAGLPASRLIVEPDKVLAVKRGFEDEHDRIRDWLWANRDRLRDVPSPGEDPCSKETVKALGENGGAAVQAAEGYINQLGSVAEALGEIARAYGLVEDDNTGKFRREPE